MLDGADDDTHQLNFLKVVERKAALAKYLAEFSIETNLQISLPSQGFIGRTYEAILQKYREARPGLFTFFMGTNPKCGAKSPVLELPPWIVHNICMMTQFDDIHSDHTIQVNPNLNKC